MKLVRITSVQYTASSTENSIPITLMGTMLHPFLSGTLCNNDSNSFRSRMLLTKRDTF